MTNRALWHINNQESELRVIRESKAEDFLPIQALYSFISLGTERLVALGKVPKALWADMQVPYMQGGFQFPIAYGYSLVGRVAAPQHPWHAKLVHLLHPHQEYCWVNASDCSLVPEAVPPLRACLASNVETAINAIWDSGLSLGDRVLVVGFGNIGALTALLASQFPAVEVCIAELNDTRRQLASQMGFSIYEPEPTNKFDVVFHTSGTSTGLQLAVDQVGKEGRVVELSWYGEQQVVLALGGRFHTDRKQIISSQVSVIPPAKTARWDYQRRKAAVWKLLENPIFDLVLERKVSFQDSPAFFDQLRNGQIREIGCYLDYGVEPLL